MKTKPKSKTQIFRQGDVLIERIAEIPGGFGLSPQPIPLDGAKRRIILAHGEATGHHHSIVLDEPDAADWWKASAGGSLATEAQFITLRKPAALVHQEHAPIALKRGTYKVTRQREYSPEEIRNVAD